MRGVNFGVEIVKSVVCSKDSLPRFRGVGTLSSRVGTGLGGSNWALDVYEVSSAKRGAK